jgi:hypothetical protein
MFYNESGRLRRYALALAVSAKPTTAKPTTATPTFGHAHHGQAHDAHVAQPDNG